jgi:hypothetical protein
MLTKQKTYLEILESQLGGMMGKFVEVFLYLNSIILFYIYYRYYI